MVYPSDILPGEAITADFLNASKNQVLSPSNVAGEAISVASVPQAVFLDANNSGKVYKSQASSTSRLKFHGFAITTASGDGSAIAVLTSGIVPGFSGLTKGQPYYVQDTPGTVGLSQGTYMLKIGIAISTTEILILPPERLKFDRGDATRAGGLSNGTQVINHNLGEIPAFIQLFFAQANGNNSTFPTGLGTAKSVASQGCTVQSSSNNSTSAYIAPGYMISTANASAQLSAISETSFTLNWIASPPVNHVHFEWSVFAR